MPSRIQRSFQLMRTGVLLLLCALPAFTAGCISDAEPAKRLTDMLQQYLPSDEPLRISRLTAASADAFRAAPGKDVIIIVHPAYALFFRDENRSRYSDAKYELLKLQLENEARIIRHMAGGDAPVVLLLPGNYQRESIAPRSYIGYLNQAAGGSGNVFYLTTEAVSTGSLPTDALVALYGFLRRIEAKKVLVGGGFVGRCEREFHGQLTSYLDTIPAFIVPEISTVSPDDVSTDEAFDILARIHRRDYAPVMNLLRKKSPDASILSMPLLRD